MKSDISQDDAKSTNRFMQQKGSIHNDSDLELGTGHHLFTHEESNKHQEHHVLKDFETFMKTKPEFSIKDNTSNPGPLGLFGFGLTTFLLNMSNAGVFPVTSIIFSMGICYGGIAQIIAGIFEWYKNRIFTSVVFISYGLFWWSLILIFILSSLEIAAPPDDVGMGFFLFMWGFLSFGFMIASLKRPKVIFVLFVTVVLLFWLLAIEKWTNNARVGKAAGIVGIICSILAIYAGLAELLNESFGVTVLPMGMPKKTQKRF